jgi:3'5'-cyclic nucleotide phosphodiesterase
MWNFPEVNTEEFALLGLNTPVLRKTVERPQSRFSTEVAKYILNQWANDVDVIENFGGPTVFARTIERVDALDEVFRSAGGAYFHVGSSSAEALKNFAATQLKYRRTGVRPSLPGQAAHYLDLIASPSNDPHYRAALLVAARAELEHHSRPEYHSTYHVSDVIAVTIEFLKKNNALAARGVRGAVKLSRQELAVGIIAAAGHDVGHPGGKNALPGETVARDPFRLERRSVDIIGTLLRAAQLPSMSVAKITAAIFSTSPDCNGPGKLLREIDQRENAGEPIEWSKLPEHEQFPELRLVAEDSATRAISQSLRCADLAQSCMFGLRSNEMATRDLQAEWRNRGYSDQLVGDIVAEDGAVIRDGKTLRARMGFLDFAAFGPAGPAGAGVKAAVGDTYEDLYKDTRARLDSVRAQEKAHAVLSVCFDPVNARLS